MTRIRRAIIVAFEVAALAAGLTVGTTTPAIAATAPKPANGPCFNVLKEDGDTTHIEVWYACNSLDVKSTRVWLRKPTQLTEAGHFELRNAAGAYANSSPGYDKYWKVNQQYVDNHAWNSRRGELVCVNYWINEIGPSKKFGNTNCVTT